MVKIVNVFGDVKTGKQGEAVYQGRYGKQIRRQLSPKRAMASEAQEKHRQFYRDALDWRKGLSPPNRRYLEGYCIANSVIDGYGIPLAWHRYALRLYLEKVHFVVITKPIAGEEGEEQEYEYLKIGDTAYWDIRATFWLYQSFTPQESHSITKVWLKLFRRGIAPLCRVGIYKADANHFPFGSELTGVDADFSDLPTGPAGTWVLMNLPSSPLSGNIEYAIVGSSAEGDASNCIRWRRTNAGNQYTRGVCGYSLNSGETWALSTIRDMMFSEFGMPPAAPSVPGLIHVRHPALLRVAQKRGEQTVKGYDTLSSLDEEYLTGQVGLDVSKGDIIEVTTLPGISYRYVVS